jgi:hypothetical protein
VQEAVGLAAVALLAARGEDGAQPAEPVKLRLALEDVGSEGFVVVLDDDGAGNGRAAECDDANNTLLWATPVCR